MPRYRILSELGRGGMGVVYRAVHVDLDREVALKLLPPQAAASEELLHRFHREVRLVGALSHPNIVRVFDSGETEGKHFYTMEIISGSDLHRLVNERGALPFDEAVSYLVQASDALAYVHARGLCHRDIKPHNIMVDDRRHVTLMDFGLAKDTTGTVLTRTGEMLGTPRFLAPEALQGLPATPAQDVYALALCAHELLSGGPWCAAATFPELASAILSMPAPGLADVRPDVPGWFLDLQARALAKDPGTRPAAADYRDGLASGRALAERATAPRAGRAGRATERRAAGVPAPGDVECPPRAGPGVPAVAAAAPAARALRRSHRQAIGGAIGALLVAAAGAAWLVPRLREAGPRAAGSPAPPAPAGTGLRLPAPEFPAHRQMRLRCAQPAARGTRIRLAAAGRTLAVTAVPARDGEVLFHTLPAAADLDLTMEAADGRVLASARVRTPAPTPVRHLAVLPTDQDVVVDFDLPQAPPFVVEVGRWMGPGRLRGAAAPPAALHRVSRPSGARWFHHRFAGLKPQTAYFVRVSTAGGWAALDDFRFDTSSADHAREWQKAIAVLDQAVSRRDPLALEGAFTFLVRSPDSRSIAPLARLASAPGADLQLVRKVAWVAEALRTPELAERVAPFLRVEDGPLMFGTLLRALVAARLVAAHATCRKVIAESTEPGALSVAVRMMAHVGGRDACDQAALAAAKIPGSPIPGPCMVAADRERARAHIARWLSGPGAAGTGHRTDPPVATFSGLEELGEERDVRLLAGLLRHRAAGSLAARAVEALVAVGTPAARAALLDALRSDPGSASLVWAAARLGIAGAAPILARHLPAAGGGTDAFRSQAACALGLTGASDHAGALRALLDDASADVRDAAAFALARVGDRAAVSGLLGMATSEKDRRGVAAWALATLGARAAAPRLRAHLASLARARPEAGPKGPLAASGRLPGERSDVRLAMICWALAELGAREAAADIERLVAQPGRSPYLVELGTWSHGRLAGAPGASPPVPFLQRGIRADVPGTRIHVFWPGTFHDRTGVILQAGESATIWAVGRWGDPDSGLGMIAIDKARPDPSLGAQLRLCARLGGVTTRIGRTRQRLVASRAAELELTPYAVDSLRYPRDRLPRTTGPAWVVIEP
jgi:serine/threonine-protein kinase